MSPPSPAPDWPPAVPSPGPLPRLRLGRPVEGRLSNGVAVMVVARPSVPRLELRLSVPAGAAVGASAATSELLRAGILLGTRELDQGQVSEAVQRLGGSLQVHQDQDRLVISAAALSEAEEELYRLLGALVAGPAFPAPDVATERLKLLEALRQARATPEFPAAERLQQLVYAGHPYGRPEPGEAEIRRVGGEQLARLHRSTFLPGSAQITVVGDVRPVATLERLERGFGGWRGRGRARPVAPVRARRRPWVTLLDRPGSVQTVILAAASAPPMGDPRHLGLQLAAAVLGGGFDSRLMANLREDKGYTYGAITSSELHLRDTLTVTEAQVRTEVTAAAYVELLGELGRLATVPVPDSELADTRRYLAGAQLIFLQTQAGLASALAGVRAHGLDHRYLEHHAQALDALRPEQVLDAAGRHLGPEAVTVVMAGDAARILEPLRRVASVRLEPAPPARLSPAAGPGGRPSRRGRAAAPPPAPRRG